MITAQQIIQKRKELWNKNHNIEKDNEYLQSVAEFILDTKSDNKKLNSELLEKPFLLIEMMFQIPNKKGKTVPFFLNEVQQDFLQQLEKLKQKYPNKQKKILILKGRQQGFTSLITAYQLAYTIMKGNMSGKTIAHTREDTAAIFQMKAKFFFEHIPEIFQPQKKYDSKSEYFFDILNSHWTISTAGSKEGGRSSTVQVLHGSEVAFWKDAQAKLAGLGEAIVPDGLLILESTANGFNYFKTLFDEATQDNNSYHAFFYNWWRTPEYYMKFETDQIAKDFISSVQQGKRYKNVPSKIMKKLRAVRVKYPVEYQQLYWWFQKYQDKKDKALQEYPHTPEDAFLTSGDTYFDSEKIKILLNEIEKNNYIEERKHTWIWEKPKERINYIIAADVAEGVGGDASSATIYRVNRGFKQVAVYHNNQISPDKFGAVLAELGREYNNAFIAVERNNHGHSVINTLVNQENYYNLFEDDDDRYGWKTTSNSKYIMLDELDSAIRKDEININDWRLLNELLSVTKDKNGNASINGKDRVAANAIAWQMRKYVKRETVDQNILQALNNAIV
jgi:hypothetical protein